MRPLTAPRFRPVEDVKGKKRAPPVIDLDDSEDDATPPQDDALWSDRYAPPDLATLCVHKKKVEDTRRWLKEALFDEAAFRFRRVLVLSGPAGAGKTATLRLLGQELDFDIQEYRSPDAGTDNLAAHFSHFLAQPKRPKADIARRKVVLVEDLPNVFSSTDTADAFAAALNAYATTTRTAALGVPLVVIVSEALARSDASAEHASMAEGRPAWQSNVTARTIVPSTVLNGGRATEIRYNPVATTLLKKALGRILDAALETSTPRPRPEIIDLLIEASHGDVRSASNSLQFLCRESQHSRGNLATSTDKGKSRKGKALKTQRGLHSAATSLVTARESSLFLFHALGKILYSKRWGEDDEADARDGRRRPPKPPSLPKHLSKWSRSPSMVDVEDVYGDLPVGIDMFAAYLHQNYPAFVDDVHQCDDAMTGFSDADLLTSTASSRGLPSPVVDRYAYAFVVRGTMLALPHPVPRRQQRIYKSQQWEATRKRREALASFGDLQHALLRMSTPSSYTSSVNFLTETVPFLRLLHAGSASSYQHKTIDQLTRFAAPAGMRDALDENDASSVAPAVDAADGRERVQRASDAESAGEDSQDPIDE